jgi:signal transduction histidine kinase
MTWRDDGGKPTLLEGGERFAAYVAHELRSPLATQGALLELTLADRDADVAAWRKTGEDVLRACRQQERLLEACLTLARSREGAAQRREPVDLAAIAAEAVRAHDPMQLESLVALEPAPTTGDPVLLGRLAANLVSNAIRHNLPGGRIEIATHSRAGRAVFAAANTGRLVPVGELRRLFQPFQRLESHPRSFEDGAGLGLTIVAAIAEAHGGVVTARARAGGGLEIDVSFSVAPSSAGASRSDRELRASTGRRADPYHAERPVGRALTGRP